MALLVGPLVRRWLRPSGNFFEGDAEGFLDGIPRELNERLVGVYLNTKPYEGSGFVFTTRAIVIVEPDRVERIPFADVNAYDLPEKQGTVLTISTRAGRRTLRVAGRHGPEERYPDVVAFAGIFRAILRSKEAGRL